MAMGRPRGNQRVIKEMLNDLLPEQGTVESVGVYVYRMIY